MDATLVWSAVGSGATAAGVVATVAIYRLQARAAAKQAPAQVTATNFAGGDQYIYNVAQPECPAGTGSTVLRAPTGRLPGHVRGRDELLEWLEALLKQSDGQVHVLAGLGGTGKSTIALRLAEKAAEHGMPAWWVPAVDTETMTGKLLELAAELGAPPGKIDQARTGQRSPADLLWQYLEQRPAWLLIFDNVDDPAVLATGGEDAASGAGWLRPVATGTEKLIIVTSRNRDERTWGRHAQVHPVEWLDPAAGGQVLTDLASRAGTGAEAIALSVRLGGLPLALHHAGSQLASEFASESTFSGYVRALDERFGKLMGEGRDDRAIVTSTWELSLDALAARGRPQARPLLRVLCCLAPAVVIPISMLDRAVLSQVCDDDQDQVADGLRALSSVGLITASQAGVSVHPLVSETSRLHAEDISRAGEIAVALLDAAAARLDVNRSTDWPAWSQFVPHLYAIYVHVAEKLSDACLATLTDVSARTSTAFFMGGGYAASGDLALLALRHSGRLGASHSAVFQLRSRVASAHRFLGRPDVAEQEYRSILDDQTRALGPDHPDTLATRHEYATTIARQGGARQEEAQQKYRDVLELRTRVLGPEHPDTLTTRYESARTLAEQGELAEAERLLRDVLELRTRVLGAESQGTLTTRVALAYTLTAQKHHGEAERELREVLAAWPRVLGADHPDTLGTRELLAHTLVAQGRRGEAREEFQRLVADRTRVQGAEHVSTRSAQLRLEELGG